MLVGRWGPPGPPDWDDKSHTGVKQIRLIADDAGIRFFQAVYVDDDQISEGPAHGTRGVTEWAMISLDFPGEYITNVSGYIKLGDTIVVLSLTFKTNRATYGPFGVFTPDQDVPFDFSTNSNFRIVGFRGAHGGGFLNAIGAFLSDTYLRRIWGGHENGEYRVGRALRIISAMWFLRWRQNHMAHLKEVETPYRKSHAIESWKHSFESQKQPTQSRAILAEQQPSNKPIQANSSMPRGVNCGQNQTVGAQPCSYSSASPGVSLSASPTRALLNQPSRELICQ
ncbi:hypothetical protein TIFTF001_034143 [Ficus carica]|uniref:Jacalin-type lectin domain-containing protein n=1 Tax=Ficus carica TaxID=3494 RepID=A0AA88E6T4_FICCA|nr:hypothetical protein TIFTF001_034143 [Ficus carica]